MSKGYALNKQPLVHVIHERTHWWQLSLILNHSFITGTLSCDKYGASALQTADTNRTSTRRDMENIKPLALEI